MRFAADFRAVFFFAERRFVVDLRAVAFFAVERFAAARGDLAFRAGDLRVLFLALLAVFFATMVTPLQCWRTNTPSRRMTRSLA